MSPYYVDEQVTLWLGDTLDVLRGMPDESVNCVVTSPPYYGLRDYGVEGQYGLEATPAEYVEIMRRVFAECQRVLAKDGTCWLNLDDSYSLSSGGAPGLKAKVRVTQANVQQHTGRGDRPRKSLLMIPERVMMALQDDGWILRSKVIWHKPDGMPESVTDRPTERYEPVYLLAKAGRYHFDLPSIQVRATGHGGDGLSNPGNVWTITRPKIGFGHIAVFPIELPIRCIKAGCKPGGTVLDPFSGSGTTGAAARLLGRKYVGIDLNPAYHDLAIKRFAQGVLDFEAA